LKVSKFEAAIDAGYIRWIGKPMNIFPELTDGGLYARGLGMTEALNTRFNKVRARLQCMQDVVERCISGRSCLFFSDLGSHLWKKHGCAGPQPL
jgi:hypothetical protein